MARDFIHYTVVKALQKEIWLVTADPLAVKTEDIHVLIDIAAERLILAAKEKIKIAVEVKSFRSLSLLHDIYEALGQYLAYKFILAKMEKDRTLFLAISAKTWKRIQEQPIFVEMFNYYKVKIIIVNLKSQKIEKWIN